MKNKLFNLAVKVTTVGMVVSMFASALPVAAESPISDTLDRLQAGVATVHVISVKADAAITGDDVTPPRMTINLENFIDVDDITAADVVVKDDTVAIDEEAACADDDGEIKITAAANVIHVDFCGGADVADASILEITIDDDADLAPVNPAAGSNTVSFSGTALVTGSTEVYTVTQDYVTVTATISGTLNFDIDTNSDCSAANGTGDLTIDWAPLTLGSTQTNSEFICIKAETNADEGLVIQVKDLNEGLLNSVAGVNLAATYGGAAIDLDTLDRGYGICIDATAEEGVTGSWTEAAPYDGTCADGAYGGLDKDAWQNFANSGTEPIDGGGVGANDYDSVSVKVAAIAKATDQAGTDTDTIYFRCTATF